MQRIKTGVPGLDEITRGGIPDGHTVLLIGPAGSGKTILCSQFLYSGAKLYKEPGVYLSFEESSESIKKNAMNFGWDFGPLENDDIISFVKYDAYHADELMTSLESRIREVEAKRVVIDSISALSFYLRETTEFRRVIFKIGQILSKLGCTSILVSESVPNNPCASRNSVEEFVADTSVILYYVRQDSAYTRALQVWKMRGSAHSEKIHPYKIGAKGIEINPQQDFLMKGYPITPKYSGIQAVE